MKPSWVLSEEERSRRFKKIRQKKAEEKVNEHQLGGGDDHLSSDYRNSAEFELEGDFIDPDNLDVLVSTMTNNAAGPVTLTSQPLQVSAIQTVPGVSAHNPRLYASQQPQHDGSSDYPQQQHHHAVKVEQEIKQEPQFYATSPGSLMDLPGYPGPAGATAQQTLVIRNHGHHQQPEFDAAAVLQPQRSTRGPAAVMAVVVTEGGGGPGGPANNGSPTSLTSLSLSPALSNA